MAIEYDLVPGPGSKASSNDEDQRLVPKVVTRSTVTFKQMAKTSPTPPVSPRQMSSA